MKHPETWLVLGSVIPLFLIFVMPIVGIRGGLGFFLGIVVLYAVHLLMLVLASRLVTKAHERASGADRSQRGQS